VVAGAATGNETVTPLEWLGPFDELLLVPQCFDSDFPHWHAHRCPLCLDNRRAPFEALLCPEEPPQAASRLGKAPQDEEFS
jgi:hypothetical protein